MPDWEEDNTPGHGVGTLAETARQIAKPPLFKVLLHNDDFTTMEFVVDILLQVFHRPEPEALQIMLAVHHQGVGVAGVYTYEIAEAKVNKVAELAGAEDFPLLCTLEQE
jgi:ATP-dependent Clp protease adaptor protein ClpS